MGVYGNGIISILLFVMKSISRIASVTFTGIRQKARLRDGEFVLYESEPARSIE
jgi:hypothetical protein